MKSSEKVIKEYIVMPTSADKHPFLWGTIIGIVFIFVSFYSLFKIDFSNDAILMILLHFGFIFFMFRIFIYEFMDVVFKKRVILTSEGNLYVKFIVCLNISKERSYLNIEEFYEGTSTGVPETILVLNRNNYGFFKRLFKNKVKLYTIDYSNREEVIQKGKEISEMFNITFWDPE